MNVDKNRFIQKTKQILEKRAGSECSNPNCNAHTSGPHSEELKSVNVGEAAHIRGAHEGSARHDKAMTPAERRNITNGIWLCRKCAKLIDSDENLYTVELLYKWKRTHESLIRRKIQNSEWQSELEALVLKPFEDESPAAQQIVQDKPDFWKYLLTVELLRTKLGAVRKDYNHLRKGLIYHPCKIIHEDNLFTWYRQKLFDLSSLIKFLSTAAQIELSTSWGKDSEVSSNPNNILDAVDKIAEGCRSLLDWEIQLHFAIFPEEIEYVKEAMQGWTTHMFSEMDKMSCQISSIFENEEKPDGVYPINLEIKAPENLEFVYDQIMKFLTK